MSQVRLLLSGKALSLPHKNSSDDSVLGTSVKYFHKDPMKKK